MTKRADMLNTLRKLTDDELVDHLHQQRRKLFEVRFQQATGQVDNHRQIRAIHKEIARTMTVQMEAQRTTAPREGSSPP
jgi:large subunit ribosomal protein L29